MRISSNSLILLGIISFGLEISACARSPGVTDAAKTSAGSRMTEEPGNSPARPGRAS